MKQKNTLQRKINKVKNWFFKKIDNIDILLGRQRQIKGGKHIQIANNRHQKKDITIKPTHIKKEI